MQLWSWGILQGWLSRAVCLHSAWLVSPDQYITLQNRRSKKQILLESSRDLYSLVFSSPLYKPSILVLGTGQREGVHDSDKAKHLVSIRHDVGSWRPKRYENSQSFALGRDRTLRDEYLPSNNKNI